MNELKIDLHKTATGIRVTVRPFNVTAEYQTDIPEIAYSRAIVSMASYLSNVADNWKLQDFFKDHDIIVNID